MRLKIQINADSLLNINVKKSVKYIKTYVHYFEILSLCMMCIFINTIHVQTNLDL